MRYQEQIIGVMVGFFGEEYVTRLLEYELFGYEGRGWFCTAEGIILGESTAREANRNANDVSMGVSRLFEKFVTLNLRTGEYTYAAGEPENGLTHTGKYEDFQRVLLPGITDPDQRKEMEALTSVLKL